MNIPSKLPDVLERQNKKLSILYEIALTVGKSLDLKNILSEVLEKVIALMGVDAGVIYVIDDQTLEMIPMAFRNISDTVVKDLCERKVKVGECMCGSIAQCDSEVIILEKASLDPRFTRGVLKKENMEFYAGLPLKARNKVVGVLCVISHAPYAPDHELLDILRAATQPIGLAIENARMFEHTRRETDARIRYSNFSGIITGNSSMVAILDLVRKITDVPSSILLYGESGTGKELKKVEKELEAFFMLDPNRPQADKDQAELVKVYKDTPPFKSIKEAYRLYTGDMEVTGLKARSTRLTESLLTTDWAQVVAAVINKRLVRDYP